MAMILGKQVTDEEWDYLMTQQATYDKEIKIVNGKVVAVEHEVTQEELNDLRKSELRYRLDQLSQDFIQVIAGAEFKDFNGRIKEFQTLHNELRILEGKEPRVYHTDNIEVV